MARNAMACILLSLIPAAGLRAEESPRVLVAGIRARVTVPHISPKPLVGTVKKLTDDAIELTAEGREDTLALPRASVLRLEVSQGRNRGKGALIGGAALAAVGAVVGAVGCRGSSDVDPSLCAAILGGGGLVVGAGVGAMVGAGDRWRELPSDRFRATVTPVSGRGVRLSMRFSF
jgi:hypothetical protein